MNSSVRDGNGRRDELAIMTDLLGNMLQPQRSTHILYRTNLSYSQLKKYLSNLLRMGLAEELEKPYRQFKTTEKGRIFINLIKEDSDNSNMYEYKRSFNLD